MKISFDEDTKGFLAIYVISLFVLIVLFVAIPFRKIAASYCAFAFCVVSFVIGFFTIMYAINKKKSSGRAVFQVCTIHSIAQFVVSIIFCVLGSFYNVPLWIVLVISTIMLAVAAMVIVFSIFN